MANYNEHTCLVCGQTYEYCRRCAVTPVVYKAEGFCSEEWSHIFNTLSKHGCNLATAKETLAALGKIEGTFTPSIQSHIDAIKAEASAKTVETSAAKKEDAEEVVEPVQYSKNKKKW